MKNIKSFESYINESSDENSKFLKDLENAGYNNIVSALKNGDTSVTFDNPEGSHFELVIEPDGEVSGDCTSVASGDPCDFLETHMDGKTNIKDFPFNDLLDW